MSTELGNMAIRCVMQSLRGQPGDDWNRAYTLGQLSAIEIFMEPDKARLDEARQQVEASKGLKHQPLEAPMK